MLRYLISYSLIVTSSTALAFDPFSIGAAKDALGAFAGGIDEVGSTGLSLVALLSDLGIDSESDQKSIEEALNRLEKTNSKAREAVNAGSELSDSLDGDIRQGRSLKERISSLRNIISNSKKIASMMQVTPKLGQSSLEVQKINLDSRILEEIQSIRKSQYLEYLENKENRVKREIAIKQILRNHAKPTRTK